MTAHNGRTIDEVRLDDITPEQRETMIRLATEKLAEPQDREFFQGIFHIVGDQLGDNALGWILYRLFTEER